MNCFILFHIIEPKLKTIFRKVLDYENKTKRVAYNTTWIIASFGFLKALQLTHFCQKRDKTTFANKALNSRIKLEFNAKAFILVGNLNVNEFSK